MKVISTIEQWQILKAAMKEKGYTLWQMQYSAEDKQGFHAWFYKTGKKDVEVVTHNADVQECIIRYNSD